MQRATALLAIMLQIAPAEAQEQKIDLVDRILTRAEQICLGTDWNALSPDEVTATGNRITNIVESAREMEQTLKAVDPEYRPNLRAVGMCDVTLGGPHPGAFFYKNLRIRPDAPRLRPSQSRPYAPVLTYSLVG